MQNDRILKHQGISESVNDMSASTSQDRAGKFEYRYPREGNEAHRWRCMKRNMRHDERLTKESAQRLLHAARELPSAKQRPGDLAELNAEFTERFGAEAQPEEKVKTRYRNE